MFSLPISLSIVAVVGGLSAWVGDFATRRMAIAVLAGWFGTLTLAVTLPWRVAWWPIFGIDVALCVYFFWISLRTRLLWTVPAAAFAAIVVASHLATVIDLRVTLNTFRLGSAMWSYGILVCVGIGGVLSAWRRRCDRLRANLEADVAGETSSSHALQASSPGSRVFDEKAGAGPEPGLIDSAARSPAEVMPD